MKASRFAALALVVAVAAAAAPLLARDPMRAVALAVLGLACGLAVPAARLSTSLIAAALATIGLLAADGLRAGDPAPLLAAAGAAAVVRVLGALVALEATLGWRR